MSVEDFIDKVLEEMEEEKLTRYQAERVARELAEKIKRNNERVEENKPFIVSKRRIN